MEADSPTGAPSWPWWWWWWWWWCWCWWWWTVLIWQHAVAKECRLAIREVEKKRAPRRRGSESKTRRTSAIVRSRRWNIDTMRSSSCYSRVVGNRRDYPPIRSSPNCDGELQPLRFIITLCVPPHTLFGNGGKAEKKKIQSVPRSRSRFSAQLLCSVGLSTWGAIRGPSSPQ